MSQLLQQPPSQAENRDAFTRPGWLKPAQAWAAALPAYPLLLFGISRLLLIFGTYAALATLTTSHIHDRLAGMSVGQMALRWNQWDAQWYTGIAAQGYAHYQPGTSSAFFPLLPLLMHLVGAPFGSPANSAPYFIAGLLISNVAFGGALVVLYRLVAELRDEVAAQHATLLLVAFPKAFFTFTAYTEGLFLLLAISSYWLMRHERFGWAGLLAGLAALTRVFGVILLIPLGMELWRVCGRDWRAWLRHGHALLYVPAALGGYMLYLQRTLGDPLAFLHAEDHWRHQFTWPFETLWLAITTLGQLPFGSVYQFDRLFDLCVVVAVLAMLGYAFSPRGRQQLQVPLSLLCLGLALVLLPVSDPLINYLPNLLASLSRYLFAAFPIFIIAALLLRERPRWREALVFLSLGLQVVFAMSFILGGYVT